MYYFSKACPVQGQVRKDCAADPRCATTCSNRTSSRPPCPRICVVNGCECPTGTIIDEDANKCITPSECPEGMISIQVFLLLQYGYIRFIRIIE